MTCVQSSTWFVISLLVSAWLCGCVATRECVDDSECSGTCFRGFCQDVCYLEGEVPEMECGGGERCACVKRSDNERCFDSVEQACQPGTDEFCLCVEDTSECNPKCLTRETCVRGVCVESDE